MPGKVTVLKHPVVNSRIADLRQTSTSPKEFRQVRLYPLCTTTSTLLPWRGLRSDGATELFSDLRDHASPQGIHDISTILAIEATRDLEEEPISGVRFATR